MQAQESYIPRYNMYLRPTYAVVLPRPSGRPKNITWKQAANKANLKYNQQMGILSKKAQKKLLNATNWLIACAKKKRVYSHEEQRHFNFRLNFITLTLPTLNHSISDHHFKKVMLHNFINQCRYHYGLKNFVWKVEAQANGNIHAHFTTDTFIHWKSLRRVWNQILKSNNLIDQYRNKFQGLTFDQYRAVVDPFKSKDYQSLIKSYDYGCETDWSDPNTTDVKAVRKVANIGGYLAKYMSKNDEGRRPIKGRLWSCSYNISRANKTTIEIPEGFDYKLVDELIRSGVDATSITTKDKLSGNDVSIGDLFLFDLRDWGRKICGQLKTYFYEILANLRNGLMPDHFNELYN